MKYRFYRTAPIDENTSDPIKLYLHKLETGSDGSEKSIERIKAEKERFRTEEFVKYARPQTMGPYMTYGFVEMDYPFPVNLFGGYGWSEMVVVM